MSSASLSQPLLLETIRIEDGTIYNLPYHQKRCTQSRQALYTATDTLDLESHIIAPPKGLYRCRVLYAQKIHAIEYIPYVPKTVSSLKIIASDIEYAYKYANRAILDSLLHHVQDYDDILIEKEGYITDTSIANIAFYDGIQWITPQNPLLKGTMRQKLIDEGFLHIKPIRTEDISQYKQVALMNAMLGFKILKDISIHDDRGKIL